MEVWKFILGQEPGSFAIEISNTGRMLAIGNQEESAVLWAQVDPKGQRWWRTIHLVMTGQEIPDHDHVDYVGTTTLGGWFVLHLFVDRRSSSVKPTDLPAL